MSVSVLGSRPALAAHGKGAGPVRRWVTLIPLATLLLLTLPGRGLADSDHPPVRLVRVEAPRLSDLMTLQQLGLDILERENSGQAVVAATDSEIVRLQALGFAFTIIEADLEAAVRRKLGPEGEAYHNFAEVIAELDRLRAERPDLVSQRLAIGTSWEGRKLWAVKISDHPDLDEEEPEVLYDALHHAREPIGMEALLHAMRYLIQSYDHDPEIRALVDGRELWFVPVVNPDGYVWGGIGGMWRKNRRQNPDGSLGVDLNRNYGYQWGYDDLGSSPLPASQTYRGPAPFSEPETQAMRDFILSRRFVTGMTLHAYSEINLLPYGWAEVRPEDATLFEEIGHDLEAFTGYPHGQPWELLYFSNGRTQDWQVHDAGMVVIEPEIGSAADGFWPPAERIRVLAERNLPAILHMARIAGAHLAPVGLEVRDGAAEIAASPLTTPGPRVAFFQPAMGDGDGLADPGETVELVLQVRNQGLADLDRMTITVTSSSPGLTVHSGPFEVCSLPARTSRRLTSSPLWVSIAPGAVPGVPIALDLGFTGDGGYVGSATVELVPGSPTLAFADDAESGLGGWTTTGSWGVAAAGAGTAFTDSPRGDYPANANNALVLERPFDLSRAARAVLRYREVIATEPWDDLCHVEARAGGGSWMPIAVLPGGVESSFRERRLSLDALAGEHQVSLRFRLTSNHCNQRDGWTIDDLEVWAYPGPDSTAALAATTPPDGAGVATADTPTAGATPAE
jgi:hypothetical protein